MAHLILFNDTRQHINAAGKNQKHLVLKQNAVLKWIIVDHYAMNKQTLMEQSLF
jgi:hypothetical protein